MDILILWTAITVLGVIIAFLVKRSVQKHENGK